MMGIVVPETRWIYKRYNKIKSGIYLVFNSSVIAMMRGPTNNKWNTSLHNVISELFHRFAQVQFSIGASRILDRICKKNFPSPTCYFSSLKHFSHRKISELLSFYIDRNFRTALNCRLTYVCYAEEWHHFTLSVSNIQYVTSLVV